MSIDLSRALPYFSPTQSADDTAPINAFGTDGAIVRSFATTLSLMYVIDEPGALVFVRERDVDHGMREDLHTRAVENLRAHVQRRKLRFEPRGPATLVKLDNHHDASLLLLDELWDPPTRIADPEGELVAVVPQRNVLMFTGTITRGGIPEMRAALGRERGHALSHELFVRRNRAWESLGM